MNFLKTVLEKWMIEIIGTVIAVSFVSYLGIEKIELDKVIKDLTRQRAEIEGRTVQLAILNGALLIRNYRADQRDIERLTRGLDLAIESGLSENIKRSEQALENGKRRRDLTYELYRKQLEQSANDYSAKERTEQLAVQLSAFKQNLSERQKSIGRFAELYVNQIATYNKNHVTEDAKLSREIQDFQP